MESKFSEIFENEFSISHVNGTATMHTALHALGVKEGSGSVKGQQASFYKHGKSVFDRYARERKQELNACEECGKDLTTVNRWSWVGHHIDHNQLNNIYSNLKILCKSCHQKEHRCWENFFEGATTIPQGSRAKWLETV